MFNTVIKIIFAVAIVILLTIVLVFFAKGMHGAAWSGFWMAIIMVFVACAIED